MSNIFVLQNSDWTILERKELPPDFGDPVGACKAVRHETLEVTPQRYQRQRNIWDSNTKKGAYRKTTLFTGSCHCPTETENK